jgi:hypothetical protein
MRKHLKKFSNLECAVEDEHGALRAAEGTDVETTVERIGVTTGESFVVAYRRPTATATTTQPMRVSEPSGSSGSSTTIWVPSPGRLRTRIEPPSASMRSVKPTRPEP